MDDSSLSDLSFHSATWSPIKQTPTRNPLVRLRTNARRNLSQSFEDIKNQHLLQQDNEEKPLKSLSGDAQEIEMQLKSLKINGQEQQDVKLVEKIEWMESTSEGEILNFGPKKDEKVASARKSIRM